MASMRGAAARLLGAVHAELGREGIERALGRIALDLPFALVLKELGVVAKRDTRPIRMSVSGVSPSALPPSLISPSGA